MCQVEVEMVECYRVQAYEVGVMATAWKAWLQGQLYGVKEVHLDPLQKKEVDLVLS